ncbi:hypothetical protein M0813_06328 [Anaeramoeba flamelloides]|uniref:MULE transposase domain-containing protein n=1 Tax=Anaeramoeba flamelloides TaxID=1746091 RepID=A0ABQ8XFF4_9EUKA|nr:hypothetical protein M0813_06328 [Anaeramoeba flamelloides]
MNLHILTQGLNLDIEKNTPNKTRTLRKRNFQNFENFNLRGFSHESESELEESDSDYDPETLTKKKQFKRTVSKKPQSLEKNLKKKKKRLKIKKKNKSTLTLVRKRKTPNKKNKKKLNLTQWSEIGNHVNFSENDHQVAYGHPQEITENQISVLESFKLLMNSELTNKIVNLLNLELKKINETATNRHRLKIKKITDNDFFKFLSYFLTEKMTKMTLKSNINKQKQQQKYPKEKKENTKKGKRKRKKNSQVMYRNFLYFNSKPASKQTLYYRCNNRRSKCKARFIVYLKERRIVMKNSIHHKSCIAFNKRTQERGFHGFAPDIEKYLDTEIKKGEKTKSELYSNYVNFCTKKNEENIIYEYVPERVVKSKIHCMWKEEVPKLYENQIQKLSKTLTSNPEQLNITKTARHLFVDGTFLSCPDPFKQLIIFSVWDIQTNKFQVINWTLIDSKEEYAYIRVINNIKEYIPNWYPLLITCDFEMALTNALQKTFTKSKVVHCKFHLSQCLIRRMKLEKMENNSDCRQLFIELKSLTLISPEFFMKKWVDICKKFSQFKKFLGYFFKVFIKTHEIETWNTYYLNDSIHTTNGFLEGNNQKLNELIEHKKPGLYKFINIIRNRENEKMKTIRLLRQKVTDRNNIINYNELELEESILQESSKWKKVKETIINLNQFDNSTNTNYLITNSKKTSGYNSSLQIQKKVLNKKLTLNTKRQISCSHCKKYGHNIRTCPTKKKSYRKK